MIRLQILVPNSFAGYFAAGRVVVPGLAGWRRRYPRPLRAI
jgi:hypothetical protein